MLKWLLKINLCLNVLVCLGWQMIQVAKGNIKFIIWSSISSQFDALWSCWKNDLSRKKNPSLRTSGPLTLQGISACVKPGIVTKSSTAWECWGIWPVAVCIPTNRHSHKTCSVRGPLCCLPALNYAQESSLASVFAAILHQCSPMINAFTVPSLWHTCTALDVFV